MAAGAMEAEGETAEKLQAATRWEPRNPEYWYRLGHFEEFNLEQPEPARALEALQRAVALEPRYTEAWLDLATAHELDGDSAGARDAYKHAEESYPASAEVSWRYGNFLLRSGDLATAFAQLRRAIQADPQRAGAAFSRVYRADPNVDDILDQVLPPIPQVYVDVVTEATSAGQVAFAQTAWARLLTLKPQNLRVRDFDPLVAALQAEKEYATARRVWDQGAAAMNLPPLLQPQGTVVWDPSFESGVEGYTFSWHFKALDQGVRISFDSSEKLSGNQSLRLSFDGKHNPSIAACGTALVNPGTPYHFSAWVKTKDITTEEGIRFQVSGGNTILTREFHGSLPWTYVDAKWTAGAEVREAEVCVLRNLSDDPAIRISGDTWVDDVNLVPEALEQHKP